MPIILITGPMFSMKTTSLIHMLERSIEKKQKTIGIKFAKDNRYDGSKIMTNFGYRSTVEVLVTDKLMKEKNFLIENDYKCIGIDEGQFFDDLVEFANSMARLGKTVIIAALNADYLGKPFSNISQLVCERVILKHGSCHECSADSTFSYKKKLDLKPESKNLSPTETGHVGFLEAVKKRNRDDKEGMNEPVKKIAKTSLPNITVTPVMSEKLVASQSKNAPETKSVSESKANDPFSTVSIDIGGEEKYQSLCRMCFNRKMFD